MLLMQKAIDIFLIDSIFLAYRELLKLNLTVRNDTYIHIQFDGVNGCGLHDIMVVWQQIVLYHGCTTANYTISWLYDSRLYNVIVVRYHAAEWLNLVVFRECSRNVFPLLIKITTGIILNLNISRTFGTDELKFFRFMHNII